MNDTDGGGYSLGILKKEATKKKAQVLEGLQQLFIDCGWKKRFAIKLGRSHETDELHINRIYMDTAIDAFKKVNLNQPFVKLLEIVGIKRTVAIALYDRVEPLLDDSSFTLEQLFEICLECTLGKYKEYRPELKFLYNQTSIPSTKGYIYNIDKQTVSQVTIEELRKVAGTTPALCLYYHTTSWRAFDIIGRVGIDTSRCRTCCDFGISPSFYLTPSIATAIDYAKKRAALENDEMCIMVFALPSQLPLRVKWFKRPSAEWGRLVASSRICQDSDNELDKYDFIYGPMCANPNQVRTHDALPIAHSPVKYQLATKYDSRRTVADCLIGTIFLAKGK